MRLRKTWALPLLAVLAAIPAAIMAADDIAPFDFRPLPRWPIPADGEDHDLSLACAAMVEECPDLAPFDDIQRDIAFDELYDKDGMLVGLHLTQSTGCLPLDEHLMLGHHHFRLVFRKEGKPEFDDMRMSLAPGVDPEAVRMIKASGTSASVGC